MVSDEVVTKCWPAALAGGDEALNVPIRAVKNKASVSSSVGIHSRLVQVCIY